MADFDFDGDTIFLVEPMGLDDISQVRRIEQRTFPNPWPRDSYRREVLDNERARYLVLRRAAGGRAAKPAPRRPFPLNLLTLGMDRARADDIVGFAGLWLMMDEAHITTLAVDTPYQGRGLGEVLLLESAKLSRRAGATRMTLEVRVSNLIAQRLYRKYDFADSGIRPRYYSDDFEDALVMWSEDIDQPEFAARLERHEARLLRRIRWESRL